MSADWKQLQLFFQISKRLITFQPIIECKNVFRYLTTSKLRLFTNHGYYHGKISHFRQESTFNKCHPRGPLWSSLASNQPVQSPSTKSLFLLNFFIYVNLYIYNNVGMQLSVTDHGNNVTTANLTLYASCNNRQRSTTHKSRSATFIQVTT